MALTFGLAMMVAWLAAFVFEGDEVAAAPVAVSPPATTADPPGDCECPASLDLTEIGIAADGTVFAAGAAPFRSGDSFWLWLEAAPLSPVQLTRAGEVWELRIRDGVLDLSGATAFGAPDALHLSLGFDPGGVAVVTQGGDRAPDRGYASAAGEGSTDEALVTAIQAAFPKLSEAQRQLTLALYGSAGRQGTYSYDLGVTSDPGAVHSRDVLSSDGVAAYHDDGGVARGGRSLYFTDSGVTECTWSSAGTTDCAPSLETDPIEQLLSLLADPSGVTAVSVAPRIVLGETAQCVVVTESTADGPHIGELCSYPDGTPVFVDDRTDNVLLVLVERATDVDLSRLNPPEVG